MTKQFYLRARCGNCGDDIPLQDEISEWVRSNPELDSSNGYAFMDKDLVIHRFKTNHDRQFQCFMFVEFKTRGGDLTDSQRDTLYMIDQMFRTDRTTPTKQSRRHIGVIPKLVRSAMLGKYVRVKAFGYHVCRLSGATPDESKEIRWDKHTITKATLIQLLKLELDPDTLKPLTFRIHHAKPPQLNLQGLEITK